MRGKPPDQAPPDAAADFEQVFRDAAPGLWRPIYAFAAGRSAVADDAVAEAFARALERADQIRDPVPWLYRTAFRLAAQDLRRGRRELGHVPRGFYLIHAPRAFYVIGRQFQGQAKPFAKCTLAFDRKTFQFYCPGTGLRWNRLGRPVGVHAGNVASLSLVPATVAQDGHILFSPFWGDVLRVDLRGNPWR